MRRLLEGGVYLRGPALIRENIVFQKKTKQGDGWGGGRVEDLEYPGILKK